MHQLFLVHKELNWILSLGRGHQDSDVEIEKDTTGSEYLRLQNSVCFSDLCSNVVELLVSEHGRPEVEGAKKKEIENLMDYATFEEIKHKGQETIGSCWVITMKEKHDGQNLQYKAKLVAFGFQE